MSEYVLGCGHKQYGETGRCAEMSCPNYTGKHDSPPAKITPVDPIAYAFASDQRLAKVHHADDKYEQAVEAAIMLIIMAGFDANDSDAFGSTMDDHVQTLLTMALQRCPQLAERILGQSDDGIKIIAEYEMG